MIFFIDAKIIGCSIGIVFAIYKIEGGVILMAHCDFTEECRCISCLQISSLVSQIFGDETLRRRFKREAEALLQVKYESTSTAGLVLNTLKRNVEAFIQCSRGNEVAPVRFRKLSDPHREQAFYVDEGGVFWMSIPKPDGWLTAKVTHTGYHNKVFHADVFSLNDRLNKLGLTQCEPDTPLSIVNTPRFRIVSAMSDLYSDWKDGRIDKRRYDDAKEQLLEQYHAHAVGS